MMPQTNIAMSGNMARRSVAGASLSEQVLVKEMSALARYRHAILIPVLINMRRKLQTLL